MKGGSVGGGGYFIVLKKTTILAIVNDKMFHSLWGLWLMEYLQRVESKLHPL